MAKKPAFLCYPSDFITGALRLNPAEKGVYYTLVMLMYDQRSPLDDDMAELARFCGCSWQKFRVIRNALVTLGKLIELPDGRLSNDRFEREMVRQKLAVAEPDETSSSGSSRGPSRGLSPPHKPRHEGQDEPRHEPVDQNYVAAGINGLADDSRARARTEVARASSSSISISNQQGMALGVDKALAGIIQRLPKAISREKRAEWRTQVWDFAQQDGIDPVLDLLPCVISDAERNRIPADLRSLGWWRKDALKRKAERESKPPPEPLPELTDDDWTKKLVLFLDKARWHGPGPAPTEDGCYAPSDLFAKARRVWNAQGNHPLRELDQLGNLVPWCGKNSLIEEPTDFIAQRKQQR